MKKSWLVHLVLGLFLGMLLTVPLATSGPIQQQVGINVLDSTGGSPGTWFSVGDFLGVSNDGIAIPSTPPPNRTLDTEAVLHVLNNAGTFDRVRGGFTADGRAVTGLLNPLGMVFNGANADRLRGGFTADGSAQTGLLNPLSVLLNTAGTVDRARATDATAAVSPTAGVAAVGLHVRHGVDNTLRPVVSAGSLTVDALAGTNIISTHGTVANGTTFDRLKGISAANLTATTSAGTTLTAPLSTWSVTNTPATATQATASRAAGAAGVRHVATSITVCIATGATAQTPILSHLRDGATGAGTILRSWSHAAPVNSKSCDNLSGLAMIGTAATAMTVEFTGAGVAASQQTVTLTGYSVQ